jgi:hypothetical protein
MGIYLEKFSSHRLGAGRQAFAVRSLVKENEEWLREQQPQTVTRYRDMSHAARNIHRLATADSRFNAFIAREEKGAPPLGLATLISSQTVTRPDGSHYSGNDLDYWLAPDAEDEVHSAVAAALFAQSRVTSLKEYGYTSHMPVNDDEADLIQRVAVDRAFAVMPVGASNPPRGFRDVLQPVGQPVPLKAPPLIIDTFDIVKGGVVSQLYYMSRSVAE